MVSRYIFTSESNCGYQCIMELLLSPRSAKVAVTLPAGTGPVSGWATVRSAFSTHEGRLGSCVIFVHLAAT